MPPFLAFGQGFPLFLTSTLFPYKYLYYTDNQLFSFLLILELSR